MLESDVWRKEGDKEMRSQTADRRAVCVNRNYYSHGRVRVVIYINMHGLS